MIIKNTYSHFKFLIFIVFVAVAILSFSFLAVGTVFADGDSGPGDGSGADADAAGAFGGCEGNVGQTCYSSYNSCSQRTSGTIDCSGNCSVSSAPPNPSGYGNTCYSSSNSCGQRNSGTIQCNGSCSASTPSNPSGYGNTCYSSYNSCGQRNSGTIQCNGSCSASTPSNPSGYGNTCYSSANACGQTSAGAIQCNGSCSASTPSNPSGYGNSCQSAANSCGQTNSGTIQCNGSCSASTPAESGCVPTPPSFSTNKPEVILGQSATLTWSCSNSTSSSGSNFSTGGATSGSVQVSPTIDTQFIVVCSNGGQASVDVSVFWPVLDISADPDKVKPGDTSLITWSTLGDDDILSCSVTGPNFSATGEDGSQVTAPIVEESTYTLTCQTTRNIRTENTTVTLTPSFEEF